MTRSSVPDSYHHGIGALILCGGLGRRMGGVEKALVPCSGKTLVEHVIERIEPQVDSLVLSVNRAFDIYRRHVNAVLISDAIRFHEAGPLAGIAAGLAYYRGLGQSPSIEWILVVPCDTPTLPKSLVREMLLDADTDDEVVIAVDDEHEHYAIALLRPQIEARVVAALNQGQHRLRDVYRVCRVRKVHFSNSGCFANINTLEELEQLQHHFSPDS